MAYTATQPQGSDISYEELASRVWPCILANTASQEAEKLADYCLEEFAGSLYDEEAEEYDDVYQSYIITKSWAEYLRDHTDEVVVYSKILDLYFWQVTHYGTAWSHVFTTIK